MISVDDEVYTEQFTAEYVPPVCEAIYESGEECSNEADFVCIITCCQTVINLCEDCFYKFREYAMRYEGSSAECMRCDTVVNITPDHVRYLHRV